MDLGWPQPDWDPAEMRSRLAEQMSVEALRESLEETSANVESAITADAEVARDAIAMTSAADDASEAAEQAALAQVRADKAAELAELVATREQKQALLELAEARAALGEGQEQPG